ncbi:MAG: DUF58 domain-containing protein [Candidatus Riflebacteria bacterium]|nr:DUF58 domain-containing protein [Candidatus Riflebacteria bacterium]
MSIWSVIGWGRTSEGARVLSGIPRSRGEVLLFCSLAGVCMTLPSRYSNHFHPEALIFVFYPIALYFLSWFYLKNIAKGFRLEKRSLPEVCREGDHIRVELEFSYIGDLPFTYLLVQDGFAATDILFGPQIQVTRSVLRPDGRFCVSYEVDVNRGYGNFQIGPLRIEVFEPLHFFSSEVEIPGTVPFKVILNPPVPEDLELEKENALTPLGDSRSTKTGSSLEFFGIRECCPGDDIRAICWSKTAQVGRLILKTFELDARPEVLLVLNTEATKVKGLGFGNNFKRTLRMAAGILSQCIEERLPTRLILPIGDSPEIVNIQPTGSGREFAFELLANLEAGKGVDLPALLAVAAGKAGPATILIVLSHTMDIPLEPVLDGLFALQARQAKAMLWALDDAKMIRFDAQRANDTMDKEEFTRRMGEFGIHVKLVPVKTAPPPEVANSISNSQKKQKYVQMLS